MKHPKIVAVMVIAVLAVMALGTTGCEEPGAPKVYRDPANTIYVGINDEFAIALESNHTTGYSWHLVSAEGEEAAFDSEVLELVSTEYEAPDSDLMGAPGEEKWTFKAIGNGRTHLHFAYVRPWEVGAEMGDEAEDEAEDEAGHSATTETTAETGTARETIRETVGEAADEIENGQETMVFTVDVGPSGSATKKPAEFTYKDGELKDKDDKVIEVIDVDLETQFALLLEANPTTGYSWQLAEPLDESMLILVSREYEQSKKEGEKKEGEEGEAMVGVGGEEVWTFRAVGEGETEISLKYVRPWEATTPDDETLTLTVNIKKPEGEGKEGGH